VAVVLGTALTALAPGHVKAASPESMARAIADISRYCTTCWRNAHLPADCWTDCTQEVYQRLLERVPTGTWDRVLQADGEERRELVRAIDAVKKRTQRARKWTSAVEGLADEGDARQQHLREEREVVHRAAASLLTSRQQRILQLSFEGYSVQEIAGQLQTSAERVSDEKYKAVRKLQAHLCSREEAGCSGLSA
jgi:RNA polymerase sigma factor (sigma-70 family)